LLKARAEVGLSHYLPSGEIAFLRTAGRKHLVAFTAIKNLYESAGAAIMCRRPNRASDVQKKAPGCFKGMVKWYTNMFLRGAS
jgi:hypothetical protein